MSTPDKILVLVRHAHRDTTLRTLDNGLSEKGRKQAELFKDHFIENWIKEFGKSWKILTSPKVRCQETVAPLAEALNIKAEIFPLLKEHSSGETAKDFGARIEKFYEWWKEDAPHLVVACSHGDWLPEFILLATEKDLSLKKAGWLVLGLSGSKVKILA